MVQSRPTCFGLAVVCSGRRRGSNPLAGRSLIAKRDQIYRVSETLHGPAGSIFGWAPRPIALGYGEPASIPRDERRSPLHFRMLLELGDEIHDLAHDGVFELCFMADHAEDGFTDSSGYPYRRRRKPPPLPLLAPGLRGPRQILDRPAEISRVCSACDHGAEARKDSIADIFVDATVVLLYHGHQP